jgi:uncharacterized SAM-binding protein YcdF (DUF218 family)
MELTPADKVSAAAAIWQVCCIVYGLLREIEGMSRLWKQCQNSVPFLRLLLAFLLLVILAAPLLIVDDGLQQSDAIVVIGGDHKPERMERAAELYRQGYAPVVILSAGTEVMEGGERLAEAEVMRRQALATGLPESVLLLEDEPLSTFQNAYYTRSLCEEHGFRSIQLVTSPFQSSRARQIFGDVMGSVIQVSVQPARQALPALLWWLDPDQIPVVLYEYYSWARYRLGLRSWRERPPEP